MSSPTIRILFVCLGNICRSPTAHGIFQSLVNQRQLASHITIDSAATGDWQIGKSPDPRAQQAAESRGYDLLDHRARQVTADDFSQFDYIFAMDKQNLMDLKRLQPAGFEGSLSLFLDGLDSSLEEVPDPYYGGQTEFEAVIDLLENSCIRLLDNIAEQHGLR